MKRMLTVPIAVHSREELPDYAEALRKVGAERVFICHLSHWIPDEEMEKEMEEYRFYAEYLSAEGFEVGLWVHAFGFGVPLTPSQEKICRDFTKIRDLRGRVAGEAFCPTSEEFCAYMEHMVTLAASLPISLLMFDDDYCLSVRPGIGCACEKHLSLLRARSGDPSLSLEDLNDRLFYDKDKSLRRIWFDLQGDTLADFARRMRAAADRVDPSLRMGFCAGYTSWDFEGISAIQLTKILAGPNAPFLRTTGAPYWIPTNRHRLGLRLQDMVELTRMQREWAEGSGVEIFDENDIYPRITSFVPASLQEGFDLAMAVDGGVAPFKYLFSYVSGLHYEDVYEKAHLRGMERVKALWDAAEGKRDVGLRVREYRDKARDFDYLPEDEERFGAGKGQMCAISYPRNHCIASRNGFPTVYGEADCEILFGENAKYIPLGELPRGAILDIRAAEILTARGVDVGLASEVVYEGAAPYETMEDGTRVNLWSTGRFGRVTLAEKAHVLSTVGEDPFPCSYRYENAEGHRFLVFCFDAVSLDFSSNLFCHYARRRQIEEHLDFLGADVPFRVEGNFPNLYAMCKRGAGGGLLLAFFNFAETEFYDMRIRCTEGLTDKELRIHNCPARVDGDRLTVPSLPAYSYVAFEILPK